LEIKDPKYEKFETPLSKETFFRIDAPYIFSSLDTLIYMDCDMVAN
jgi:lipopolysaccharide biosynthesis glycosyltransferase